MSTAGKNALKKAAAGGVSNLSEGQLRSALAEGLKHFTRVDNKAKRAATMAKDVVGSLVTSIEVQAGAFSSGLAYGLFGESLKLGGRVDVRLVGAAGLIGWGLWSTIKGKGGGHQMAIANGMLAVLTGEAGAVAGQALRSRYYGGPQLPGALPGVGPGAVAQAAVPAVNQPVILSGPIREIMQAQAQEQAAAMAAQQPAANNPWAAAA
jgi:hypothetical protein